MERNSCRNSDSRFLRTFTFACAFSFVLLNGVDAVEEYKILGDGTTWNWYFMPVQGESFPTTDHPCDFKVVEDDYTDFTAGDEPASLNPANASVAGNRVPPAGSSVLATPTKKGKFKVRLTFTEDHKPDDIERIFYTDNTFVVVEVKLAEATFGGGNHGLKTDNGTYGSNGTGDVRVPQIKDGEASTQICYTWESSPTIYPKYSISPTLSVPGLSVKFRIEGVQNGRTGTLIYEKDVTLTGTSLTPSAFTVQDATMKLKKLIDNTSYDLTWKVSSNGGTSYATITSTSNTLYVTAGTPGGGTTTKTRINRVTSECKGLLNEPDIVAKLWKKVAGPGSYLLGAPYPNPEWKILDGTPGECIAIANLFEKTIQMTGLTPGNGSVMYLYADAGKTSHENASTSDYFTRGCKNGQNGHTNDDHKSLGNNFEKLTFQDGGVGPNNWDNWEACYKYRHNPTDPWIWYAAGTDGSSYNSVQACMNDICVKTRWRWCKPNWTEGGVCKVPGPYPEAVW